jgi:hypothetical protein
MMASAARRARDSGGGTLPGHTCFTHVGSPTCPLLAVAELSRGMPHREFSIPDHHSKTWVSDILGRGVLAGGIAAKIYFTSGDPEECNWHFKVVYQDGTSQEYTERRDVCRIHAVEFGPHESYGC